MMKIDIPYYEDSSRISNSSLGWFISKGPRYFRDMLDGKEEGLKLPQLEKGTMIHEYILQPEEFWNDYTILDFEVPKVKQQKELLEYYKELTLVNPLESPDILKLQAYKKAYSNSKSDDKCLEETNALLERYSSYIEYLDKMKDTKKIISFADLNMLKKIKQNIDEHYAAKQLLTDMPGEETHNEFHINWEYPIRDKDWIAPCKSLLDRVKIDHVNRKITLIDLKTTSDVYNFKHSVEIYDYYRQIAYYIMAITWYMNDMNIDISDYDLEAYIIAIQTNGNYEVRVFDMKNEQELVTRATLITNILSELAYHYQTGNWDHTRNYYENYGIDELT